MRVLFVTQHFPPEVGAAQNRVGTFSKGLAARGHELTVVCAQPNHPQGVFQPGYGKKPVYTTQEDGLTVRRIWLATSPKKTLPWRLAVYSSFAATASAMIARLPRHDVAFISSPPLPGVLAAAAAARARRTPYVADIRDLWPAAAVALGELTQPQIVAALERAEARLYRSAAAVTATTAPFCRHIDAVAGRHVSVHLPNGATDALYEMPVEPPPNGDELVIGYAGNLGLAQGLGIVIDAADRLRDTPVRFVLIGDGPRGAALRADAAQRGLTNVEFRPEVPQREIGAFMQSCDVMLVPLADQPALADFIPSKLYDAMAVSRAAIVASRGEAASLATETGGGLVVEPEDGEALAAVVRELEADRPRMIAIGERGREAAANLTRSRQLEKLEQTLLAAAR